MVAPVAVILKGYPRLSETFIAQEIRALETLGLDLRLFSLRHPTDPAIHPIHREIRAPVRYLPEYLGDDPSRVARAWQALRPRPSYREARRLWLADLRRDPTRNRVRRFGQALVLAHELPPDVRSIHAHFLHTPASVARYAAKLTGLPWSCSAHAKDIWTTPEWEIRDKLGDVAWLVTCTRTGYDHLSALSAHPERLDLVYHGLDFARFPRPRTPRPERDGRDPADPAVILSVGRAVAKKGYDTLLGALAGLPTDLHWRFVHVGGGTLAEDLKATAEALGIADRVAWRGPQPQDAVLEAYRGADLFVLASRIAADGDRDGLPNVLMEAQSQDLACLATSVSGIPELIEDGVTGLLVPPEDQRALANGVVRLIREPALRAHLAAAAGQRLRDRFSLSDGVRRLAGHFGLPGDEVICESRSMPR
jgi:glycosyltransferase involved in cell wall biosynthesis